MSEGEVKLPEPEHSQRRDTGDNSVKKSFALKDAISKAAGKFGLKIGSKSASQIALEGHGTAELGNQSQTNESRESKSEAAVVEPVRDETIKDICSLMTMVPRLQERMAYDIPYRTVRRKQVEGVYDEETGLFVEVVYDPDGDRPNHLKAVVGLNVILSTSPFVDSVESYHSIDKMRNALQIIYGGSEELNKQIDSGQRLLKAKYDNVDRLKFELSYYDSNGVKVTGKDGLMSGFSVVAGNQRPDTAKTSQVTESGGQFIKKIVERAVQKQIQDFELDKKQVQEVIAAVRDEVIPNDESKVYQYAYHATLRSDIPGISQGGLLPSGEDSKEPGTIFFNDWDEAKTYLPESDAGEGVLYRFRVKNIPAIAKAWDYDDVEGFRGTSISTRSAISADHLDFSLDGGETWMPVVSRKVDQAA